MARFECPNCRKVNDRSISELKKYWGENLQIPCLHCGGSTGFIIHSFNGILVDTSLDDGYTDEERLWWWSHFGLRIGESCLLYTEGNYTRWFVKQMIELYGPQWWLWKTSLIAATRSERRQRKYRQIEPVQPKLYNQMKFI